MSETEHVTSTADVVEHHLNAFMAQDMSELLADYSDDSVIISNLGTFRGRDEIEAMAEGMFAEFSQSGVEFDLDARTIEGEIGFVVWQAETPDNIYEFGTDTYLVRDGFIETQTFAANVVPKH